MTGILLCGFFGSMVYYLRKTSQLVSSLQDELTVIADYVSAGSVESHYNSEF